MSSERVDDAVAAVDLGSNSFHLIVARRLQGDLHVLDRLRERVALAEGLDADLRLTEVAQARALECLERFGQRLRDMPPGSVRAVGTNTLRQAKDARAFMARARRALGHPIEVVSGHEEARLIYLGVASGLPPGPGRRLVIDIGGGSTECILGERLDPLRAESLIMGCVSWSGRWFPGGAISESALDRAVLAARLELEPLERPFRALGWDECIGSSGTIVACGEILRESGWSESGITRRGLRRLAKELVAVGDSTALVLPGLSPDRAPVLAGGVAVLLAVFEAFGLREMRVSERALREGLLHDLMGRMDHEDVRDATTRRLVERFQVDVEQAARVERTALAWLDQVAPSWGLSDPWCRTVLSWAARLHEVGLSLSHSGYHKHGAYVVTHADMPGFSREDQLLLAALVHGHRRRVPTPLFSELPSPHSESGARLCVLLRLAVRVNRSRSPRALPAAKLKAREDTIAVTFPAGWLAEHPLTLADLQEEADLLHEAGVQLTFS